MPREVELDEDYRPELERAWERLEARIAALPHSLALLGQRFLEGRVPGQSHRWYFSDVHAAPLVYLPLWLRAALTRQGHWPAEPSSAFLDSVLCATMWGYFYIRIQDDLLDERMPGEAMREQLLFSNVCVHEMARLFDEATCGSPAFRASFERTWLSFSQRTLDERAQLLSDQPYTREQFEEHAAKVAFAEAPMMAVCLRAGRADLQPWLCRLVHSLGVAHGLLNDVRGFARDARNGHRTYLLARAGWSRSDWKGLDEADEPLSEELRTRLYEGGLVRELLGEAREALKRAVEEARPLGMELELARFVEKQLRSIEESEQQLLVLALARALRASD